MSYHPQKVFVLSDKWICYVESSMPELVAELRKDPEWAKNWDIWQAVKGDPNPSEFAARRKVWDWTRDRHIEIRDRIEAKYADPTYYTFEDGSHPLELHHVQRGIDDSGLGGPEYTNYCYLRRGAAIPLLESVNGEPYYPFLSDAIKINQAGYLPYGPKIAYVGAHLYPGALEVGATEFIVCSRFGLYKNLPIANKGFDPLSGEHVYELDFSSIAESDVYQIHVPGIGNSHPFRIADDVYDKPFAYTMAGFDSQRSNRDFYVGESEYFHLPNKAAGKHPSPVKEIADANHILWGDRFDYIRGSTDMSKTTRIKSGEFLYDAADFDTNQDHYNVAFCALYAYEKNPHPWLLDIARAVLMVWRRSMTKEGGVSGFMETDGHHAEGTGDYVFGRRTRWASLEFAAAAALMAMYDTGMKERGQWAWYAQKAFRFGADPVNSLGTVTLRGIDKKGVEYTKEWTETEELVRPYLTHAAIEMFRLTGQDWYGKHVYLDIPAPYKWPHRLSDSSPWRLWSAFRLGLVSDIKIYHWYTDPADELVALTNANPYGFAWPADKAKGLGWGESQMTNAARCLLLAYELSGDEKYKTAAIQNLGFTFGANPLGMCWLAGMGHNSPSVFQHPTNAAGIMPYGVNEGMYTDERAFVQKGNPYPVPVLRRYFAHPTKNAGQCEFTVGENAPLIFCTAYLREGEWAGEVVKNADKVYPI